jgi:hypothetical protein
MIVVNPLAIHARADGKLTSRRSPLRRPMRALCAAFLLVAAQGLAQESSPVQEPKATAENAPASALATVHGVVRNAATGEPLPRALVKIEGNAETGALTDGEGRFEIPGVPVGLQSFDVVKPGFNDEVGSVGPESFMSHNIRVAAQMPGLNFSLAPTNVLSGRVMLSTGEPGASIGLTLLRLAVEEGCAHWSEANSHQTTPEGAYRFNGLKDGIYTLMTQPEFDNERASAPACNGPAPAALSGYPIVFYPDSADVAGATRIELMGGREAQANLTLTPVSFHAVQASTGKTPGAHWQFTSLLTDRNGQRLSYPLREDQKNHSFCAYLPDGAYTLTVEGSANDDSNLFLPPSQHNRRPRQLFGLLDFTVDGRAQSHLRVPLSEDVATPIHLRYEPGPPAARQRARGGEEVEEPEAESDSLGLWAGSANGTIVGDSIQRSADSKDTNLYELGMTAPGAYWIHASSNRPGTCLGAVTAGGTNLAHQPWIAGTLGTGTAIDAVVRTDCAKLTLQLPASILLEQPGEEPTLFVYVVPEFDSVQEVHEITVRPSAGAPGPLEDLTPGSYRVFVFGAPQSLEYRNPAAMERLAGKGQEVSLSPGGSANLVLEAPPQ